MASTAAGSSTTENNEKSKTDRSQVIDSGLSLDGRRQGRRAPQVDLSGFIGADGWMVGKYER